MNNTQVLLTHKDDGLPLAVDELVGVSSLKVVDELDEVAVTALAMMFGAQVRQLTLTLDVVDADLALYKFLHEKIIPQRDMLYARNVGTVVGDVQRQRVIDMQRPAARCRSSHRSPAPKSCWSRIPPRALPPSWTVRSAPVVPL